MSDKEIKKNKVFLVTFGCQMNVRDSEVIAGLLKAENWQLTTNPDEADVVILNTCSVRQHAEEKVWSEIGRVAKRGKMGTVPLIGLVGCMAQNYKEAIFQRAPAVDFVVGPSDIERIPDIINKLCKNGDSPQNARTVPIFERKIWETDGSIRPEEIYHTGYHQDKEHGYVVISEGCSNYCSYCLVPYVRGQLRNRSHKDILREIEEAVAAGIKRITLLGQNVCAYGTEYREQSTENRVQINFIQLLKMVDKIEKLKEFSFVTSHPKDTGIDLFRAMAGCAKLKKYLHLPVQSGSDKILKLMNRGYTRKFYLDLAKDYRKIVPEGKLTSDIIVGFPGESEEDFADTDKLVEEVRFNAAYIFKYSPRPHTEAAKLTDDVPPAEKQRRHSLILELQKRISKEKR
jgi:tRNA-2-methylthio-N6-dimethylallyladenosine synthase